MQTRPKSHLQKRNESEDVQNGSGALAPQEIKSHQEAGLKSHLQKKNFRHLPHIDLAGYYQFVTFRTHDSVDEFIRKWDFGSAISKKEKQLKIDDYLDRSNNGAYLQNEVLEWLFEFLLEQDKKLYELVAFAIMNNHVHMLFKPLERLSKVMQKIKGASAKKINELLEKSGQFWADDYYDKAIIDERHFWVVYEYIKNNPLKIYGSDYKCGTEVPTPNVKIPHPNSSGTEVPPPRFYGVYE
ncbi:MAG TPA: hypothetical protein ENN12_02740 [Epsilonproteobacteria bacterium]|nr:hypothetical protein [Campylobacterota bacterium]